MFLYYKLIANFRGQSFEALICTPVDYVITNTNVTDIICKKLQTTIPGSEISHTLTKSNFEEYETYEGTKKDFTLDETVVV